MLPSLFTYSQYLLPQHFISSSMGFVAQSHAPWLKNLLIRFYIKHYQVDMSDALIEDPFAYPTFNHFFTRQLKPETRPIARDEKTIASPVDGTIMQLGQIHQDQLFQAKGFYYNLKTLLGDDASLTQTFLNGEYITFYLAPYNYHRVHMPLSGRLEKTIYIPGHLFSVNRNAATHIPKLYTRNERLITIFDTKAGPMAVIFVGAINVGNIQTIWMQHPIKAQQKMLHTPKNICLDKGEELGYFKMGSTVILLFGKKTITWLSNLTPDKPICYGEKIAEL